MGPDIAGTVEAILDELYDRAGFSGWWDNIDVVTQGKIRERLADIIIRKLDL